MNSAGQHHHMSFSNSSGTSSKLSPTLSSRMETRIGCINGRHILSKFKIAELFQPILIFAFLPACHIYLGNKLILNDLQIGEKSTQHINMIYYGYTSQGVFLSERFLNPGNIFATISTLLALKFHLPHIFQKKLYTFNQFATWLTKKFQVYLHMKY